MIMNFLLHGALTFSVRGGGIAKLGQAVGLVCWALAASGHLPLLGGGILFVMKAVWLCHCIKDTLHSAQKHRYLSNRITFLQKARWPIH